LGSITRDGKACHVFYTSYKSIKDYSSSKAISAHITGCLDGISGEPWVWMMDCKYVQAKHMMQLNVAMKLLKLLGNTYGLHLMGLYLINSGPVINTAFTALSPFITKEFKDTIRKVPGTPLEILNLLTGVHGFTTAEVEPVIRRLMKEYT
jgi:hypothetical protein